MDVLIVVDMQKDFIDGALGTKEAVAIVPNVVKKMQEFQGQIYCTRDTHTEKYLETQEGKNLPVPHCIKDTQGWQIHPEIQKHCSTEPINKPTFGSTKLVEQLQSCQELSSITLVGLCTDICVISNALLLKAAFPEVPITVDSSCCAGVTPESHNTALEAMKMCQIQIV